MKILALDIATKTGWATDTASGVWNLKPVRGESVGMRVVRFKAKVKELILLEGIEVIAYEMPAGRHKAAIMVASQMVGVLMDLCEEHKILYTPYTAQAIKKLATGKGNAGKPAVIAAAKKKFPHVQIIDDNHADALWLLEVAKNELLTLDLEKRKKQIDPNIFKPFPT